jgi:hypothetical protein
LRGLGGGGRGKGKDREWIIAKYIASLHEGGVTKGTESYWIIGGKEGGEKEGVNLIKVQYIHVQNTTTKLLWTMNIHFKNEEQDYKTGLIQGWLLVGGWTNRVKEGEFGQCTLYSCMKIKQWNPMK